MRKNILLTLIALFCAVYCKAYDFKSGNFYYAITGENTVEVSQCDSRLTAAYIPAEVIHYGTKYSVTSIGANAFADCGNLTSVIIPGSVISLGDNAFENCSNLISITIPNGVTSLGEGAFMDCSNLSSITIPNSVTSVGKNCFYNTLWYSNQSDGIVYINNVLYNYKGNMPQGTSIVIKDGTASICGYAFYNCTGLTSVSIPNSVTSIGSSAFYGCSNLTTITIPENIKCIEERTFYGCIKLTSIAIPNSVTSIGQSAFKGCGITSVTIPDRITSIEQSTFESCARLTSIAIPNSVKSIGESAFSYCHGLTSITIPDSVTTIGDYAFYYCDELSSIVIGKSVVSIGARCLKKCSKLTSVTWNAKAYPIVDYPDNPFEYRYKTTDGGYSTDFDIRKQITSFVFGNDVDSIPMYLCEEMSNLTSITIPKSVTCIGDGVFRYCEGLTSVTIDNSATSINYEAFLNCKNISSVSFGNNVSSIGEIAFAGCDALRSVTIPNSVTSIGEKAFVTCSNLTSVVIGEGVTDIGKDAFTHCPMLMSVVWNAKACADFSKTTAPFSQDKSSAYGYDKMEPITSFVFGEKVEHIPSYLCYGLENLADIAIPNSVTSIGTETFMGCKGLTSVVIPRGVKNMGSDVFKDCTGLTSVIWNAQDCDGWGGYGTSPFYKTKITSFSFGDEVESIPHGLCSGMNITTIAIPNSVTSIGDYAFYDCKGLTSVTIPNSVTSVGNGAFSNCLSIMFLTIGDNVTSIGNRAFESCTGLYSITIPNRVKNIGEYAFYNCSGLSSVIIGDGVDSIERNAFEDCTSLTSIVIPNCVTSIGREAFSGCNSLSLAVIGDGVTSIEGYTFGWCSALTSVTIGSGIKDIAGDHQSSDGYAFKGCNNLSTVIWNAKACRNFTYEKTPFVYGYRRQYYGESGYGYKYDIVFDLRKQITSFAFGEDVDSIPDYLCDGMTNIEYIQTEAMTPPVVGYHSLNNIPRNILVYVPCGTKSSYQNAAGWNRFSNFIEPELEFNYTINAQSANQEQGNVTITNEVKCENRVTIEATANYGYHFTRWSDGNTDNPRTLILTQDTTFIAEFAANEYTVSAIPSESKYGKVSGSGTYKYQSEVLLTVKATNIYHHFSQWNDGNTDNPRTIIVTQDTTFTAEFAPNQYTIIASGEHGTIEGTGTFDYQTRICLTAIPDKGYHFVKWNNSKTSNPLCIYVVRTANYVATFAPNQYTITTYAQNGNVSGGGTYDYGTTATLTATADAHYHFTQWSDGNTDNPRTVAVEDNATYTAEFKPNSYTITVSAGEHGNVSGGGTYDYGTTATLRATADEHYHFTQWTDGNTDNPRMVSVEGDAAYTAEFAIDQHTITANAQNGNVSGGGTYDYGTAITLTAIADEHYHFTQWSDGSTDNPRTITVEGDATYTADFRPDQYAITATCDPQQGTVTGAGTYDYGTQVTLTAVANKGYEFAQWSNGVTDNPYLLTATADLTLEAQFIPATAVDNVSADGTTPQKIIRDGQVYILRNGKTFTTTGIEVK